MAVIARYRIVRFEFERVFVVVCCGTNELVKNCVQLHPMVLHLFNSHHKAEISIPCWFRSAHNYAPSPLSHLMQWPMRGVKSKIACMAFACNYQSFSTFSFTRPIWLASWKHPPWGWSVSWSVGRVDGSVVCPNTHAPCVLRDCETALHGRVGASMLSRSGDWRTNTTTRSAVGPMVMERPARSSMSFEARNHY